MYMLEMRSVAKVFRTEQVETHALRSLELQVKEGEFVAVTGPSGSGKTTTAQAIIGLLASVIAAYYYLRIVKVMYFDDPAPAFEVTGSRINGIVLTGAALFTVTFLVYLKPFLDSAMIAAASLFG